MTESFAEGGYSRTLARPFARVVPRARPSAHPPGGRIPARRAHDLLREAAALTGDASIGLSAGRTATRGAAGALDYAMHSAPTLAHAFHVAARFFRSINAEVRLCVEQEGALARLSFESATPIPQIAEDFLLSAFCRVHLEPLLPANTAVTCHFTSSPPRRTLAYAAAFPGATLHFESARCGFELPREVLAHPLPEADPVLHQILVELLEREQGDLAGESPADRVRRLLTHQTPLRDSTLPLIARALGVGTRTLSRRLHAEGTTLGALLEEVRKARALRYLEDGWGVQRVAHTLGFSGASAFHRAFKRWTGQSPTHFSARSR